MFARATRFCEGNGLHLCAGHRPVRGMRASLAGFAAYMLALLPAPAHAQLVQISNLSDVGFGQISDLSTDVSQSQTVCAYSGLVPPRYSVTATGSGAGGAFTLSNGASTLAYEVQWNSSANQTSGTKLTSGASQSGFTSSGVTPTCTLGLTPSGSMTIVLRAASLASARAGTFSGTLSILLSPN